MTPKERLWQASSLGQGEAVETALKAGVDVNAKDSHHQMTALHYAAMGGHADIVAMLIAHGAQVNVKTLRRQTPLYLGVLYGYAEVAKALITGGADVNASGLYERTPLHIAAGAGLLDIVTILLENGADPKLRDSDHQYTARQYAEGNGHTTIANLLSQAERGSKFVGQVKQIRGTGKRQID